MNLEEYVMESLRPVEDPEMKIGVVDLGLIYGIRIDEKEEGPHAEIDMTLTSWLPSCTEIMAAVPSRPCYRGN